MSPAGDMTPPPDEVTLRDGRKVILRPAVPEDAQAMLDFMHEMLPESQRYIMTTPDEFKLTLEQENDFLRSRIKVGGTLLLAMKGPDVVGSLGCDPGGRQRIAHVGAFGIALRESWRGVGLGRAMLTHLIAWAQAHPTITKLSLQVFADNARAIALYRKFGFIEEGRLAKSTQREPGVFVDDLVMGLWLGDKSEVTP